jgi:hypothetical protein
MAVPLEGCILVDANNTLGVCNETNCSCLTCDSKYGFDPVHKCKLCNSTIDNCTSCLNLSSPNPVCTSCNVSFFVNSTTYKCDLCLTLYQDCFHCLPTVPHCIICRWGFYILPNYTCTRCPASLGPLCWGCYNQSLCWLCLPGWGFSAPNVCVPCNGTLNYCAACVDIYTCYLCVKLFNIVMVNGSKCVTC